MKKLLYLLSIIATIAFWSTAKTSVLRTNVNPIDLVIDGNKSKGGWTISPQINPDIFETTAKEVVFISDVDTLVVDNLSEWESFSFQIITNLGDTSNVRVIRSAANPYENPNPSLLHIAPSGLLTREQAAFDIDALIYSLNQVHPDIFSICSQEDLMRAVNSAKATLPDSISKMDLYRRTAPIVAMIGDGHTNLRFPYNSVFTEDLKRMPVYVDVLTDHSLVCTSSLDSIIPRGSKILSINGISNDSIVSAMMPFVSGERPHFKISRIDAAFTALFQMLFPSENYVIEFNPVGEKKTITHSFPATSLEEINKRCPSTSTDRKYKAYSFEIDSAMNVAVMEFNKFSNTEKMKHFADSMFTVLRDKNIGNLIIDLRNNGGGNSNVGDVLLRYISPEPFTQIDKALIKITPLTSKLMGDAAPGPGIMFHEADPSHFIRPRTDEEGHYNGKVYLLTSNKTFSSAGSFAWTFKQCNMGTVIGEETGGMNVCYGDVLKYELPISRLSASISYKRFWQLRADENDIHGTIPDVKTPASEALETAMRLVKR